MHLLRIFRCRHEQRRRDKLGGQKVSPCVLLWIFCPWQTVTVVCGQGGAACGSTGIRSIRGLQRGGPAFVAWFRDPLFGCFECGLPLGGQRRDELPYAGKSPEDRLPFWKVVSDQLNSIRIPLLLGKQLSKRFRGHLGREYAFSFLTQGEVAAEFRCCDLRQSSQAGIWVHWEPQLIIVMPPLIITMASPFICCIGAWLLIIA